MLSCKQASHLLSQSIERRLPLRQRLGLRLHLLMCSACKQFSVQLQLLRQATKRYVQQVENDEKLKLPNDVRKRIAHNMEQQVVYIEAARQNPDQNFTG